MAQCYSTYKRTLQVTCPVCEGHRSYYHQFGYNAYQAFSSGYSSVSNIKWWDEEKDKIITQHRL